MTRVSAAARCSFFKLVFSMPVAWPASGAASSSWRAYRFSGILACILVNQSILRAGVCVGEALSM